MSKTTVGSLPVADRIALAEQKTNKLVDGLLNLLPVHEANQIIVYTPRLASQIPPSYAAHAFNSFSDSLLRFEVVRLCALFDPCRDDDLEKESIPAVVGLIDDPEVLDALIERARHNYTSGRGEIVMVPEAEHLRESVTAANEKHEFLRTEREAKRTLNTLKLAIKKTKALAASGKLKAVRNVRDKFIAHSLRQTNLEKKEGVQNMQYGDEKLLLWKAIVIVDALYCGVNGTGFAWKASINMARRNAAELWNNCSFQIGR